MARLVSIRMERRVIGESIALYDNMFNIYYIYVYNSLYMFYILLLSIEKDTIPPPPSAA
jgi:hypothetical protein